MERGEVGIVLVRDASRISRNPLDAERFLSKAMAAGVLIEVQGRIFDTASQDLLESFGFRMQSIIAWYENATRVRTFRAAKEAKIKQGYAISRPPIGYVRSVRGKWVKDPDPKVREAIEHTFQLYLQLGSINNVVRHLRPRPISTPTRVPAIPPPSSGRAQVGSADAGPNRHSAQQSELHP
jgi:DNA invertase Pin-like site-specific DNA recombinase